MCPTRARSESPTGTYSHTRPWWSPGFMVVTEHVGKPRIYVSHRTEDTLLPLRQSLDRIVPTLKDREYHVTCHEFEGGHVLPRNVMTEALDWFLG